MSKPGKVDNIKSAAILYYCCTPEDFNFYLSDYGFNFLKHSAMASIAAFAMVSLCQKLVLFFFPLIIEERGNKFLHWWVALNVYI